MKDSHTGLEKFPTIDRLVVYLDFNIFAKATRDADFEAKLQSLVNTKKYFLPFTHVHIFEVKRISGVNRAEDIDAHLSTIKKITESSYLDYRQDIRAFTIRPRDPFEVFEAINDIPDSFIEEISKITTDAFLRPQFPGLPENCYGMADQYKFFVEMFRNQFPDLGKEINNKSKDEAIRYLEDEIFKIPFEQSFGLIEKIQKESGMDTSSFSLDFYIDHTLYLAGFKTPNKDLKKPSGLMSDHQHLRFAGNCPIIISDDENFRRKIQEGNTSKYVAGSVEGIEFLLSLKHKYKKY